MDAYRIGVSIALANGVSPVLAIIGKDLLGLNTSIKQVEGNFKGWSAALIGVGSILAGATILGAMTKLVEKTAEFQDVLTKVSQLNPKVAEVVKSGEMKSLAFNVGANLGMKVEDVTAVYGGIYGVLQDTDEAKELTPIAARYARLMEMRHKGSHPEQSINTLMRAGELSGRLTDDQGKIDPKKVEEWFDTAARLEAATHGQVNAETLLGLAQQGGGVALRGLSQEGYEHMAIVAQMMGGQRAGTSLLSLRSQMTGAMLKRSAQAMQDYGLLKSDEWDSEGGHVTLSDKASHRMLSLVNQDPMKFVNELVDRLEAKGITNKDDQMVALQRILGRQTTQRMVADMLLARQQIERETKGLEQGATVKEGLAGYSDNINANLHNLSTAWSNLLVAVGGSQGENFVHVLQTITSAIQGMTSFANAHPEAVKAALEAVVGLGAALVVIGGISLATLVGIPAAVSGVAIAITALAALEWQRIKDIFEGIRSAISSFIDSVANIAGKIGWMFGFGSNKVQGIEEAPLKHRSMFTPSNGPAKAQPISLSLNVDGRTLAQAISDQLESLYGFPTGAPAPDGVGRFYGGDHNYTST